MYQHTVVSAAPACGVGVPIRSHVRKGKRAGLESRSNSSSPTFLQGKVQLPPPLRHNLECRQLREGSDSGQLLRPTTVVCKAIALRENARSYNNALSLTLLAAHFDQAQLGIQGPRIPVVNQRSSLCSNLAQAGDTAKEWVLRLCLPPGRDRRTHNLPPPSMEMTMLICNSDTNTGDRGPQELIVQGCKENSSHLNTPLCGFHQAGPPIARNREQIDNGVQLREVLPVSVWTTNEEDKDRNDEDEDRKEGDEEDGDGKRQRSSKGVEVASLAFTILCALLAKGDEYFSIPHCTHGPFLESVIYGYTPSRDQSTLHIRLHQENLHLTTTQGINGLAPNPIGRSMTLGSTFKNRPRDITQRYQDAMACVVKHGKPPLLITMTYDPNSPEIKAAPGPIKHATVRISLHECSKPSPATSNMQAVSAMNRTNRENLEQWATHVLFFPAGQGIQLSVNPTLFRGPNGKVMAPSLFVNASKRHQVFIFPPIFPNGHQKVFDLPEQRWNAWWKAWRKVCRVHSDAEDTGHLLSLGSLHPGSQVTSPTSPHPNNRSASCVMCLSEAPECLAHLAVGCPFARRLWSALSPTPHPVFVDFVCPVVSRLER
ncbi:BQ5605_C005g03696 [Microbotryum silenes-dioicae]|uniref:BQ5605_C005g03696 protein n=1 Tax=Microbotryum silenes-dioicae TaxID=796604 RepID=A0A2X0N5E7_9BASI|nr:BQ5605_C005g03696 [Microbotryum silenes-dioicae]